MRKLINLYLSHLYKLIFYFKICFCFFIYLFYLIKAKLDVHCIIV